ncbi:MAG: hypothetical protein ACYCUF_13155, partial [Acidimicrobiales bacterium]
MTRRLPAAAGAAVLGGGTALGMMLAPAAPSLTAGLASASSPQCVSSPKPPSNPLPGSAGVSVSASGNGAGVSLSASSSNGVQVC